MIIVIYPAEMECKGIAVKYKVMKMYGESEGNGMHFLKVWGERILTNPEMCAVV
jgi:hypothetical protein